jgi:predicted transcriptional regulator
MDNFANTLSAGIGKEAVSDYVEQHDKALTELNTIDDKIKSFKIKTIKDYIEAFKLKGLLSSLFCYSANNKKKEFDRVADLENNLGEKIGKFARNYKKITPDQRKLGKYILWPKRYTCENMDTMADAIIKADMLRKSDGKYYIIGINLAVGDNTFGFSNRTGKQWRLYNKVCCFMAIGVSWAYRWGEVFDEKDVPELEDYYEKYWVGNYKGGVKISLSWQDKQYIQQHYVNR